MTGPQLFASLGDLLGEKILEKTEFRGETTLLIGASDLREVARFCRNELSFDYLLDISSVDNFGEDPRFAIVYELYSLPLGVHLRLKVRISEDPGEVETVSDIWPTADWHEREIYDMMGTSLQRSSRFAKDSDVGWLSLFPTPEGISFGRFA
jgi:NADH-quinone oxidoreductase subunit C